MTEASVLRRRLEESQRGIRSLKQQQWWKEFWDARPEHGVLGESQRGHGIIETRNGLCDATTLVCACGELFEVTGMELADGGLAG